ncbi:MAG: MvdC/MvdD family ATP grasp protein [Pseudonocardia sp.]
MSLPQPSPKPLNRSATGQDSRDTVLVISGSDPTAAAVMAELSHHPVEAVLIDIGDFPAHQTLVAESMSSGAWAGTLRGAGVAVDLRRVRSVYYRRPTRFSIVDEVSTSDAVLAEYEARLGLGGVLAALDCPWICDPHATARAEYKPLQLTALCEAGLAVPRTLITNDYEAAVEWAGRLDRPIVCKQMSPVALTEDDQVRITYTTPVDLAEIDPATLAVTAHCLQEQITDKLFEARVTMIGHEAYGVAIHADSAPAALDWRRDYAHLRYQPFDPPTDLLTGMRQYLHAMNLRYGCFDLVATPRGFLVYECNPAGQYLWLEHATGLPISAAIATHLVEAAA